MAVSYSNWQETKFMAEKIMTQSFYDANVAPERVTNWAFEPFTKTHRFPLTAGKASANVQGGAFITPPSTTEAKADVTADNLLRILDVVPDSDSNTISASAVQSKGEHYGQMLAFDYASQVIAYSASEAVDAGNTTTIGDATAITATEAADAWQQALSEIKGRTSMSGGYYGYVHPKLASALLRSDYANRDFGANGLAISGFQRAYDIGGVITQETAAGLDHDYTNGTNDNRSTAEWESKYRVNVSAVLAIIWEMKSIGVVWSQRPKLEIEKTLAVEGTIIRPSMQYGCEVLRADGVHVILGVPSGD